MSTGDGPDVYVTPPWGRCFARQAGYLPHLLTSRRCSPRSPHCPIHGHPNGYPRQVANQVRPQKSESQHQTAERGVAQGIQPGCVIQLTQFDEKSEDNGQSRPIGQADLGNNNTAAKEDQECPQRVARIGRDEWGQVGAIAPGRQAKYHDDDGTGEIDR